MQRPTKTVTIRLPVELYQSSVEIARKRHVSLNALVVAQLSIASEDEAYRQLFDAFTEIAKDQGETDVEFAAAAQWEVRDAEP